MLVLASASILRAGTTEITAINDYQNGFTLGQNIGSEAETVVVNGDQININGPCYVGLAGSDNQLNLSQQAQLQVNDLLWVSSSSSASGNTIKVENSTLKAGRLGIGPGGTVQLENSVLSIVPHTLRSASNVALNKPATAANYVSGKGPDRITDGNPKTNWHDFYRDTHSLMVDLQDVYTVSRWVMRMTSPYEVGSGKVFYNYRLQYSTKSNPSLSKDSDWIDLDVVTGNVLEITDRNFTPKQTRYVRILVDKPCENTKDTYRGNLYQFELYESFNLDWQNQYGSIALDGSLDFDARSELHLEYASECSMPVAVNPFGEKMNAELFAKYRNLPIYMVNQANGKKELLEPQDHFWQRKNAKLPHYFELPYKETGKRDVSYLAPDAFSPERLAEGEAIYLEKCGACHTDSGKDLVMFGESFAPARVVSSTKKFAGALGDAEAGEKVYEFLRYNHPGPFMTMDEPFLQSGPLGTAPGSNNPPLNKGGDFWPAWTGHETATIEDIHFDYHDYNRSVEFISKNMLNWKEWMPHFIPPAYSQEPIRELLTKGTTPGMVAQTSSLFNSLYSPLKNSSSGWDYDSLAMAQYAQDGWNKIQAYEYQLPTWVGGEWTDAPWTKNGYWDFAPNSSMDDVLLLHGVISAKKDISGDATRTAQYRRLRYGWWETHSALAPTRDYDDGVGRFWSACWYTGQASGMASYNRLLLEKYRLANLAKNYPTYVNGKKDSAYREWAHIQYRYGLMDKDDPQDIQSYVEYTSYLIWKAMLGTELASGSGSQVTCGYCGGDGCSYCNNTGMVSSGFDPNEYSGVYTDILSEYGQEVADFFQVVTQRRSNQPSWKGDLKRPALLARGPSHIGVGQSYNLHILRAEGRDGDVVVSCSNLPSGATLVRQPDSHGDHDYYIRWTPKSSDIGNYQLAIKGQGSVGQTTIYFDLQVSNLGPAPELRTVPEQHSIVVGQQLTVPIAVQTDFVSPMEISMSGQVGRVIENARGFGGVYTVVAEEHLVGAHEITLRATDQHGRVSEKVMQLSILANSAPKITMTKPGEGPGGFKNIFRAKAGETLRIEFDVEEPDGDTVHLSKSIGFPGYFDGNSYVYKVSNDVAKHFPGPNVLTVTATDTNGNASDLVMLVYFEESNVAVDHYPYAVTAGHQIVASGSTVYLDGTGSDDPNGSEISYQWEVKTEHGPSVSLTRAKQSIANFTAPVVSEPTTFTFHLKVTNKEGLSDYDVARVKVMPPGANLNQLASIESSAASDENEIYESVRRLYPASEAFIMRGEVVTLADAADKVDKLYLENATTNQCAYFPKNNSAYIVWNVEVPSSGQYLLNIPYYSTDSSPSRNVNLVVNGAGADAGEFDLVGQSVTVSGRINQQDSGVALGTKDSLTSPVSRYKDRYIWCQLKEGGNSIELQIKSGKELYIDSLQLAQGPGFGNYSSVTFGDLELQEPLQLVGFPDAAVFLSDLPLVSSQNGWQKLGVDALNNNVSPIVMGNWVYEKGFGFHTPSVLEFNLKGNYLRFVSDTFCYTNFDNPQSTLLEYRVYGDGKLIYQGAPAGHADMAEHIDIDVVGVNLLRLEVNQVYEGRHPFGVWAGAYLLPNNYEGWKAHELTSSDTIKVLSAQALQPVPADVSFDFYAFMGKKPTIQGGKDGSFSVAHGMRDKMEYKVETSEDLVNWSSYKQTPEVIDGVKNYPLEKGKEKIFIRVSAE